MTLPHLHIEKEWFKDEFNRTVLLRGVNLGGDCKVPFLPNGHTHIPTDFSDHKEVSFIGRPFPLDEAETHFSRLKAWGFNVLRLLTTWEAVEHKGPGEYDTKYLDYYAKLCEMAGDYGLYVFVDFHQDVWSRMTGGDGAPGWLFEKIGIDYTKLNEANAALVMQHAYDFKDPRPRQEYNYPTMCWGQNYQYAGNAVMWTLFFAGEDFAYDFKIDGENVQLYMQNHYLGCLKEIGNRVKDFPNVLGFDSLNEPSSGWVGVAMDDRHLSSTKDDPALPGLAWAPIDALYSSHGFSIEIPNMELSILKGGFVPKKNVKVNPKELSIWINNQSDPFMGAGAWNLKDDGTYEILQNDFFQVVGKRIVEFDEDYMFPFIHNVAKTIREINPKWMIFAEKDAKGSVFNPDFPLSTPPDLVNATHWYDMTISGTKRVLYPFSLDIHTHKPVIGKKDIQKMYERQIGRIKDASLKVGNGRPTLLGEFGIHMDLSKGKAYKKWKKGNRSNKIWKKHVSALDLMYNALDTLLINGTLWNYTASNRNDLRIGDGWNQEDLSIFCEDQRDNPTDINSGARAIEGWCRPFARFIQGIPQKMEFNRKRGIFTLNFYADDAIEHPTEIYIPNVHFPKGYIIDAPGLVIKSEEKDVVQFKTNNSHEKVINIIRK